MNEPKEIPTYPDVLYLMERLGLRLSMDYDGTISGAIDKLDPREVGETILELFRRWEPQLMIAYRAREAERMRVCMGGPSDGHRIARFCKGAIIAHNVRRGRWAVYEVMEDGGRAVFQGFATSQEKARRKELQHVHQGKRGNHAKE